MSPNFSLDDRTALVTGATGALGGQFAKTLAAAGAHVVLAARRLDRLDQLAAELNANGSSATSIEMDVTDPESVTRGFEQADCLIDIVINNSGIAEPVLALEQKEDDWQRVMAVNLDGARRVAAEAARRLVAAQIPGSIINIASILGLRQGTAVSAYATSKAALIQLTKEQALEWARYGIRVNAIAPGYIETDINRDFFQTAAGQSQIKRIPMRRLGSADELDGALLLLASDAGSFITGTTLVADGGHMVSPL